MTDWNKIASNMLKVEMKKRSLTYDGLREKLELFGIKETEGSIKVKIHRGGFSFVFFLQCALAMEIKTLRIEDIFENTKK